MDVFGSSVWLSQIHLLYQTPPQKPLETPFPQSIHRIHLSTATVHMQYTTPLTTLTTTPSILRSHEANPLTTDQHRQCCQMYDNYRIGMINLTSVQCMTIISEFSVICPNTHLTASLSDPQESPSRVTSQTRTHFTHAHTQIHLA